LETTPHPPLRELDQVAQQIRERLAYPSADTVG